MKNVNSDADPRMNQRDPTKEYNQLHPTSLRSSGTELDPCCGEEIGQASAGLGLDKAIREHDEGFKAKDETEFQASTTSQGSPQTGMPPMMSPAGRELASKTAPSGALDWRKTQIGRR